MLPEVVSIEMNVIVPGASTEELDRITRTIRSELAEQPVENVALMRGGNVTGAKSVDAVTIGALALAVLPTVLPKVLEFLEHWTLRSQSLSMKLKLKHGTRSIELELPLTADASDRLEAMLNVAKKALTE
jgi:hypothetical protein